MGIGEMTPARKAVFLDRDGVINKLVLNPDTQAYESPHRPGDLVFCAGVFRPLKELRSAGFKLFIVSNQPSYAKGKTTLKAIKGIARKFRAELAKNGVPIEGAFYCYHHPDGIVPGYAGKCRCRKPSPFFLLKAQKQHKLNLKGSWMIGDRSSDIECGRRAGCKTILIRNPHSAGYRGGEKPDHTEKDLKSAVIRIIEEQKERP